jgi:leucyl aminopeptidase
MKIRIEVQTRETPTEAFSVLWTEGKAALGALHARDKKTWQPAVDAMLAQSGDKAKGLDSDLFRNKENILLLARLPRKNGLDRSERVRLAAGSALEAARARGVARFGIALDQAGVEDIRAAAEGLLYAEYEYRAYKTAPGRKAAPEAALYVKAADVKAAEAAVAETRIQFAHIKNLRDWVNTPGSDLDPATFADIAVALGKKHGLTVKVRDEKQLQKEGFMGLWTVGKGSDRPPRMVTLEYKGDKTGKAKTHFCIVGKGVTFDTGGISLKPPASMWEMKCDMAGAATALASLCAIAELKLPIRASAVICLAENRPGNASVLPGDIFKARNGKTVMVDNTDAEGRLVLSDGLFEAGSLKATHVINIATLTGAVVRALGPAMTGLFANDAEFGATIKKAGAENGEKFWELPLEEEYREWMEDPVADMKNVTSKPEAGAITAGLFLSEFVPAGVKWSHWDVAGTAFTTSTWKYFKPGATGFGLKTLVALAKELVK